MAGHLYCDACGAEYRIVPDFEPELETSMAQTLSGLSEAIQESPAQQETDQKAEEEKKLSESTHKRRTITGRIMLLFFLLCLLLVGIIAYRGSSDFLLKQAKRLEEQGAYIEAANIYERLIQKQPENEEWYLQEAYLHFKAGNREEAIRLGLEALQKGKEKEKACLLLLSVYLEAQEYEKMNDLLAEFGNERLQQEYALYMAPQPVANYTDGSYNTILELVLDSPQSGAVHYTLDGSLPGIASPIYEEPILLGNGQHSLKAVYINSYGVASSPLELEIEIKAAIPLAPVVEPASGTYGEACFIVPVVEEGTRVYYTMDGTEPTDKSIPYRKPIPMPLGESRFSFVAYSDGGSFGEVTTREYLLNMKTGITQEEAENLLIQKMIQKGYILDRNGALSNRYGVHRYFYSYPVKIENDHYYVFEERYLENEINQRTGSLYAVDVMQGECYRMTEGENLEYSLAEITQI